MNGFLAVLDSLRRLWPRVALAALLAVAGLALADEPSIEDGAHFDVRSAFLEPADGVYQLNATLDLAFSRSALQAIREGVPVVLQLDLAVARKRRYLPDEQVGAIVQRWQIHYHALSERYLVNNLNSGEQTSFSSLGAAFAALSQVRGLPVIDESLIERGERYEASLRATAAVEGGLPSALRIMMFWIDWKRSTEWYTWSVRP